jgi:hypothetical protein
VQTYADLTTLVPAGAHRVERRGEHQGGRAECPTVVGPWLDDEGNAPATRHQAAPECWLEPGLPVLPCGDALAEKDHGLRVEELRRSGEGSAQQLPSIFEDLSRGRASVPSGRQQIRRRPIPTDRPPPDPSLSKGVVAYVCLEASEGSAFAWLAVRYSYYMSDLARSTR